MSDRYMGEPVYVKDGAYMIREITTLDEAFDFMEEWPGDRRGTIYDTTLRALMAAHDKRVPIYVARNAFAGFAKSAGILESAPAALPWMAKAPSQAGAPA